MDESKNLNTLVASLIFFFTWILVMLVCIWYNKRNMAVRRRNESTGPDAIESSRERSIMFIETSRERNILNSQEHPSYIAANRRTQIRVNMLTKNIEDDKNANSTLSTVMEVNDKDSSGKLSSSSWHSTVSSARTQPIGIKSECPICLSGYEIGDTMCWSKNEKCNHKFHEACILQWLENHRECPLCRTDILGPDDEGEA